MKNLLKISTFVLALIISKSNVAQQKSEPLWGTPCVECLKDNSAAMKGAPSSVQNGNAAVATSYTATACGLNFTQATVRLNKRAFSITPSTGVNQPATFAISGIPPCFTILKAYLYSGTSGNGIAVTANITNPLATAASFPMTIIGTDVDKCWSYAGTYTYRADVTSIISGNGNYIISGLPVTVGSNDTDGATLFIVYTDPSQNYTGSIVIGDGCNVAKGGNKTSVISGFNVCGPTSLTTNFMIIGDLQKIAATPLNFNSVVSNYTHPTANQNVWDYIQQPGAPATSGQTTATYGVSNSSDCYNFCMAGMYYRTACNVCTATNLTVTAVTSSSCSAGSATANVVGGTAPYSYTWSPTGGNAQTINGVATGIYTVVVKDATGCKTGTATVNVSAATAPTITGTSGTICAGGSTTLNAGGALTYTWSPGTGLSTTSGSVVVASPGATTTYTISGSNAAGCVGTRTVSVLVNLIPVPVIGNNGPVCLNSPINLTAGGGTSYSWSGPNSFSSAVQNPTIVPATVSNAGVYTVTVTSLGCTNTATTNVTVNTPTASSSNTGPYCVGSTIQLNTPIATSYTWSGPGGFTSNLQNPTITAATIGMSGTYTVLATTGACPATATTVVVVNALPTPAATNTGPYCPGNTIQLNVGAFTTYTWSGPGSFSSNIQNANQANAVVSNGGVYIVTVTDANGCVNTSSTAVVVNPTPVVVIGSNSPVCLNTTVNLTSAGGTAYAWTGPGSFSSTMQNPTIANATAFNAGIYTVTVTSLGCSNTGTVNIAVLSPTTTASNTGAYCSGATIQLNTPGGSTYNWTGPLGFISSLQNPTIPSSSTGMSGVYSVTVSVGTCTAAATTSVTVNQLPVPNAISNSPVCANTAINFTGSGGTTYTWSGPAFNSNLQNPTIANASIANSGTYTLTVTDANSCVNFTTTNVLVNPLPVIVVNNPTVCANQTLNFTATGGSIYSWSGPAAFTSNLQNPSIVNSVTNMSGAYTVTVTTAAGCSLTAVSNGVVNPLPNPVAQSNSPVCVGNTINLIGTGGTTYTWTGPGGFASNLQSPNIPNCGMPSAGTNTLTVGNGFGCIATATVNVVVNPLPTPQIISNSPVCVGQPINFTGSGGTSYSWVGPGFINNSQNPNIPVSSLTNNGTFTLTVIDANNCVNSITQNVIVNPLPNPTAAGSTACENSNVSLSATGGVTYSWTGPGGFTSNLQNATISNAQLSASGQYTVFVTDINACTNTAVASIIVNPMPDVNAVSNGPICVNTNLNLLGNGGVSYAWSGPNGFTSNLQNPSFNANTINYSGNYNLTVTDANGCSSSTVIPVLINGIPNGAVQSSLKEGCAPLCVTFTINSSSAISNYNWNLGNGVTANSPSPETCYGTTGVYTISAVVSDAIGCMSTVTYTVEVYPQPIADFNHAPLKPIINQDPDVTFTDASHGANIVGWNWYFMNTAQYTSNVQNPTFMYTEPGTYAVALVVKSDKGCTDTIVRPLVVGEDFGIYVPNAFTPNNDGLNEIFQPKGFGIVKYELQIFDRWGEKVFQTKNIEEGWNGSFQNRGEKIIENGVYTWLINVTSVFGKAHELKGHVTLIK